MADSRLIDRRSIGRIVISLEGDTAIMGPVPKGWVRTASLISATIFSLASAALCLYVGSSQWMLFSASVAGVVALGVWWAILVQARRPVLRRSGSTVWVYQEQVASVSDCSLGVRKFDHGYSTILDVGDRRIILQSFRNWDDALLLAECLGEWFDLVIDLSGNPGAKLRKAGPVVWPPPPVYPVEPAPLLERPVDWYDDDDGPPAYMP